MAYKLSEINDINNNKSAVYKQIYIDVNGFKWIGKPNGSLQNYNNTNPFTVEDDIVWIIAELSTKQDLLVSGVNIKTINGDSILGSGDIVISGGGGTWGTITGTITDQTDLIAYLVANYEPLLGYTPVPETRTLTINGTTYDLSADRSWTISTGVAWGGITGTLTSQTDLTTYLSSNYQPLDADLSAIAALSTTSFGRGLLTEASASSLITTLSLVVGTNVQAWDTDLDDLSTKWTKASSSGAATLQFNEDTDNGTNKVTLKPAESLSADYTVTLPSETGTLITDATDEYNLALIASFRFLTNN